MLSMTSASYVIDSFVYIQIFTPYFFFFFIIYFVLIFCDFLLFCFLRKMGVNEDEEV